MKARICALSVVALSGCATVPDVTLSYYPAKWNAVVTLTQTVACANDNVHVLVLNALAVAPNYASDSSQPPFKLAIRNLDSAFADSDLTMTFTDDGRLKSINQSTTGQGEAIVKSAVALSTTLGGIKFLKSNTSQASCEFIAKWGKDKPVTLTYRAMVDSGNLGKLPALKPTQDSDFVYNNIKGDLPTFTILANQPTGNVSGPSYSPPADGQRNMVLLELQRTSFAEIRVDAVSADGKTKETLGPVRIAIPRPDTYTLPIPKAAFFGKQNFSLVLSEAGAVVSVGYGKTSGAAGFLNAIGAVASTETASAKAAELKAEADLIAQQQRLALCKSRPNDCK